MADWEQPSERPPLEEDHLRYRSDAARRTRVLEPLRKMFRGRCCYCTRSELELGGPEAFDVEHYRPESDFDDRHTAWAWQNLYYACHPCNQRKSSRWPDPQTTEQRFVDPVEEALYSKYLVLGEDGITAAEPPGQFLVDRFGFAKRDGIKATLLLRSTQRITNQLLISIRIAHGLARGGNPTDGLERRIQELRSRLDDIGMQLRALSPATHQQTHSQSSRARD